VAKIASVVGLSPGPKIVAIGGPIGVASGSGGGICESQDDGIDVRRHKANPSLETLESALLTNG
jgi:hypothetical protein